MNYIFWLVFGVLLAVFSFVADDGKGNFLSIASLIGFIMARIEYLFNLQKDKE